MSIGKKNIAALALAAGLVFPILITISNSREQENTSKAVAKTVLEENYVFQYVDLLAIKHAINPQILRSALRDYSLFTQGYSPFPTDKIESSRIIPTMEAISQVSKQYKISPAILVQVILEYNTVTFVDRARVPVSE